MIFHRLVYSIIFFVIPITIQSYSAVDCTGRSYIYSQLPDEDTMRFTRALTDICQNYDHKSSALEFQKTIDEFTVLLQKKEYKDFIFAVMYRIARDRDFAKYLRDLKIDDEESFYSFFVREAQRFKKFKSNFDQQKYLLAIAEIAKKNHTVLYEYRHEKGYNPFDSDIPAANDVGPPNGVLKDDEKNQDNDVEDEDKFDNGDFEREFVHQINKVLLKREHILEKEYLATCKILEDKIFKKKVFDYLSNITNDLLALFATEPNLDLTLEQEEILDRLVSSSWPSGLPTGSIYQRMVDRLKLNICSVMIDLKGFPKNKNQFENQEEKAKIIAEFLTYTFGTTSAWDHLVPEESKDATQHFLHKGSNTCKVPFLQEAYQELNKDVGRVERVASFFYDTVARAGKSLASIPTSLFDTVADTLSDSDDFLDCRDYCNDLDKRREAFLSGDYTTAFEIANKYYNTPYYQKMIEPLKKSFFDTNNEYGIPLDCQQDPLWVNMPDHIKNLYRNSLLSWKNDYSNSTRFEYNKLEKLHELRSLLIERLKAKDSSNSPQLKNESTCSHETNEYYHRFEKDLCSSFSQDVRLTDLAKEEIAQVVKNSSMRPTVNNLSELEDRVAAFGNDYLCKEAFELRLEALQQAHLYQDPNCRQLFQQLPEYNAFVCKLVQELEKNPKQFLELRHTWWQGDKDLIPVNLETYFKSEANRILQDKQKDLAAKSHENFVAMSEHLIAATDSYLDNLDKLPSFESKPEIRQQLQNLNMFAHEIDKGSKNFFDQQDLCNTFSKISNGPLDLQDLLDAIKNNNNFSYRYWQDAHLKNVSDLLEDLEKKIEQDPIETIEESFKQLDDLIADHQTQLIIDEYHIQASSLIKTYITPEQQAVHEVLKSKLADIAPKLNENEKKLAASLAEAVISLNDAGRLQEARSFLDALTVDKLNEFFNGITSGLKERYTPDIDKLVGLGKTVLQSAVTQRLILVLAPEFQIPYYIYQFATMASDTYTSGNLFLSDITELLEVIKSGDMHRVGQLVVQTAHDGYDIYVGGKGLRNMGSSLVNAYKEIKKNRTGGGKRNNKEEKKERYNYPTCKSMNDFLDNHELGKTVKTKSMKTGKLYYSKKNKKQGAAIYNATANIEGTPIQKGDYFYLDYAHKDHIEVFNDKYKIKTVIRLDGSIWKDKENKAKADRRTIKEALK